MARNAIQEEDEDSEEEGEDAEGLFLAIYRAWTHNAVASFSLCLMAQQYELAAALIFKWSVTQVLDRLMEYLRCFSAARVEPTSDF